MENLKLNDEEKKEIEKKEKIENDDSMEINHKYIKKVTILLIIIFIYIQGRELMLNKIFVSSGSHKNIFTPINAKVLSSGYDINDFERERKLKVLKNLSKKYDKDYIDKCTLLLYRSKKTKDYALKRQNIAKTIYKYDENKDLYVTLPKFKSVHKNMKKKQKTTEYFPKGNYFITDKNQFTEKENEYFEQLKNNINEGFENDNYNFNTISNNNGFDEEISEKEQRLYNLLKTRYPKNTDINININDNSGKNKILKNLPKILYNKKREEMLLQKRISDLDPKLGKKIKENKTNFLTKDQQFKIYYLSELKVYDFLDNMKNKIHKLNKSKSQSKNSFLKREKLIINDLFHYDKDKWAKISYNKNFNDNETKIKEYNEDNTKKLMHFKSTLSNLEAIKIKTEFDIKEIISNIDTFLQRNASTKSIIMHHHPERTHTQKSFKLKNKK